MTVFTVNEARLNSVKHWFSDYTGRFNLGRTDWQRSVSLKIDHTRRVCSEIRRIGEALGLDHSRLRFAELVALLHDIGRFEQFARFKTYSDSQSENHAELGVKVLAEDNILDILDEVTKSAVVRVIRYHNRIRLPEDGNEEELYFARLLRDADKLDIFRVVTEHYQQPAKERDESVGLGFPDTDQVTDPVVQSLVEQRIVDIRHVKNLNDFKLLQVSWVFDINYRPTFQLLKQRGYIRMIQSTLPESSRLDNVFREIDQYIDRILLD